MQSLEQNFSLLKTKIYATEKQYSRRKGSVELLAVSKGQPITKILQLYAAGQRHFGENYCQEAITKINQISKKDIIWHFIGPVQSNKASIVAESFSWVHSVSRIKIAQLLNNHRPESLPPLNICIQVNLENSPNKSGIPLNKLEEFTASIMQLPNLKLRGLMTIPEIHENFEAQRKPYQMLHEALINLNNKGYHLDTLSMGMSNDYEAAIAEGATLLRVGTLLFGKRTT